MAHPRPQIPQGESVAKPGTPLISFSWVCKFDIKEVHRYMPQELTEKKVCGQKHPIEVDKCRNSIPYFIRYTWKDCLVSTIFRNWWCKFCLPHGKWIMNCDASEDSVMAGLKQDANKTSMQAALFHIALTHLPLVPYICVGESDDYLNQCWVIVNWALKNKLQWHFNLKKYISFTIMHLKISSAKWRPYCPGRGMS